MNEALVSYSLPKDAGSATGSTTSSSSYQLPATIHHKDCSGGRNCSCLAKKQPPVTKDPRRKRKHRKQPGDESELSPVSSFHKAKKVPLEPIIETPDVQYLLRTQQSRSRQEVTAFWQVASMGAVIGGVGGLLLALVFILVSKMQVSSDWSAHSNMIPWQRSSSSSSRSDLTCPAGTCEKPGGMFRGSMERFGIQTYLDLFGKKHTNESSSSTSNDDDDSAGKLQSHRRTSKNAPKLVIAGKMAVEDGPCNIAQYNLDTKQWSLKARIQLSLYNSYSGGEVYSLLANHTSELSLSKRPDHGK